MFRRQSYRTTAQATQELSHVKVKKRHEAPSVRDDPGVVREAPGQARHARPDLPMLRHNFASELIAKSADVRTVQEYMGHSSLRMLQRYAHVNKGIWRSTIQLLGRDVNSGASEVLSL
jgi:site-specific recombinase XerC